MKASFFFSLIILTFSLSVFAQDSIPKAKIKPEIKSKSSHKVFANIFTGAYYNFKTKKPNAGFELSTALLGYRFQKSDNLQFTIIYDVTRTTGGIHVTDSAGNNLPIKYFAGSEYTAFLKMAEIKWYFAPKFSLSAGQLLNEQYLTKQDKIWGHRYVMTTMQELFRMANPADFGMRIEYRDKDKLAWSLGANNGNGPFYKQDTLDIIEYTSNLEIYLIKDLLIKGYIALTPATFETENNLKTAFSGFIAYQKKKYKIGLEYSYTKNINFTDYHYSGTSGFISYNINPKWEVFARYDYVDQSSVAQYENVYVGGFQYQPQDQLFLSLNYRYWSKAEIQQIYFNLGAKF